MDNMMLVIAILLIFGLFVKAFRGTIALAVKILVCVLIAGFIVAKIM